ncbi:MAG: diguanylate cyclase and metal dependent phosphohydrolase [Bryobacterales bacterium]|nr:diguanylate cyclase and metal dependent phosphohydrolase [Bryobacterales bacterium]
MAAIVQFKQIVPEVFIESPSEAKALPRGARVLLAFVWAIGTAVLVQTAISWRSPDLIKFGAYLAVSLFSAGARVRVPGVSGPLPLSYLFVLLGLLELTAPETILLACGVALVECYWRKPQRPRVTFALLQIALMAVAAWAAEGVFHSPWFEFARFEFGWLEGSVIDTSIRLAAATLALFLINTAPTAAWNALTERERFAAMWLSTSFWSLPHYLAGAGIAQAVSSAAHFVGWQTVLLTGPVVYLIYRSYRLYLIRLEGEKRHAEELASLHLRTIEALALAIEAKDHTTHDHLQRVQVYARELAHALELTDTEKHALEAAALLHDIGKLAVPEHIISKPGRLTPEEFEKMKIHPIVGAEILERVRFPYPVAPIVRAHHEKWDGSGYPSGLKGEAIPIGARILAVVDCLDALASDRQYRRALPLEEAMKVVRSETGKAFDPRVVDALAAGYVEWERKANVPAPKSATLSTEVKVERGAAPAAGFEASNGSPAVVKAAANSSEPRVDFLNLIAAARQEVQALFEISQDLGNSLSLGETLSVLDVRLRHIIPHHSLAVWLKRGDELIPEYVNGEDCRLFSSLRIPMGQGLSGWVAENGKPIVNGNPSVEPSYLNDRNRTSLLQSAVAVPLEGSGGIMGVLTLYHMERDAFTKDHLRILMAIHLKIGMSIENALKFQQAESSATTDYLTSLPNARSLFLQLDAEVSRARRNNQPLTVVVLDLDELKQINDRYGHLEGNRVLREVAIGLKANCREYDYVARMGGDEFVVLLSGAKPADAENRVEEFRRVVAGIGIQSFDKPLSASIGVAHLPGDGGDAERLLAEADRLMYQQKRSRKHHRAGTEKAPAWARDWNTTSVQ